MDSLASQAESGDNIKVKKYTFLKVTLTANCDIYFFFIDLILFIINQTCILVGI